jgi:hypothetical protein
MLQSARRIEPNRLDCQIRHFRIAALQEKGHSVNGAPPKSLNHPIFVNIPKPKVRYAQLGPCAYPSKHHRNALNITWPRSFMAMNHQAHRVGIMNNRAADDMDESIA